MPSPRRVAFNARLLLQSALQHAIDDPAVLAVQASRRLPVGVRIRAGKVLRTVASALPGATGAAALGAFMAGDAPGAQLLLAQEPQSRSSLHGEVSVLLDRPELLSDEAPAMTRARSAWSKGEMSEAIEILESAGQADSAYALRLRSELELLRRGHRLRIPSGTRHVSPCPREGDELRVLHLITNSLPHTQSGYSLRTHRILRALAERGIRSIALTRTGYTEAA